MRIAKDGKPFDVDNEIEDTALNEVEIIQFIRPMGRRRRMLAIVGEEMAQKANSLILSCEILQTGEIVLYARKNGKSKENEMTEFAQNGPGDNSPTETLKRLILRANEEKP